MVRAGSGTISNIILHLFAHIYSQHYQDIEHKPLFLTYNETLLEEAKNTVKTILSTHPNYVENQIDTLQIDNLFYSFKDFLELQLDENEKEQFLDDTFITFLKIFNKNSAIAKRGSNWRESSEVVWHTIRTYLQGKLLDIFTIENYRNLPEGDRSISTDTFNKIFNNQWSWWQRLCVENGFWNDLDLVRYILKNNKPLPQYAMIFCDEAQDFTKLEIALILKLSTFCNYNTVHLTGFPIAFAGDPLQTITPTGFRFETLKQIFVDAFAGILQADRMDRMERDLSLNYRSKAPIVKFANLVQTIRSDILGQSISLQDFRVGASMATPPKYVILSDGLIEDGASNKTTIIIPEDEGINFNDYANSDNNLSYLLNDIKNLHTAVSIKGLEQDKVVLYRFGEKNVLIP